MVIKLDKPAAWLLEQLNRRQPEGWPEDAEQKLEDLRGYLRRFTEAKNETAKMKRLKELNGSLSTEIHSIRPMLNGNFNVVPAQRALLTVPEEDRAKPLLARRMTMGPWRSENLRELLLAAAISLGYHANRYPKRLKECPYCRELFWDGNTRSANKRTCGKTQCVQDYASERSRKAWWEGSKGNSPRRERVNPKRRKKPVARHKMRE